MSSMHLDNLLKAGLLKEEPFNQQEFEGLVNSGQKRLNDALNTNLAFESRFDLAYNAAHALSLAALRCEGYRSHNRYAVFQVLPHTIGVGPDVWRILAKCHDKRNLAEYEGFLDIDEKLLDELLISTKIIMEHIVKKVDKDTAKFLTNP